VKFGFEVEKQYRYSELLRLMFRDQVAWILQPEVHRHRKERAGTLETASPHCDGKSGR